MFIVRLHVRPQLSVVALKEEMSAPLVSKPRLGDDECEGRNEQELRATVNLNKLPIETRNRHLPEMRSSSRHS